MSEPKTISIIGDDPVAELAEMIGESFDRVVIKRRARTGGYAYLKTMPTHDYSNEWLAEEFGAGSYSIAFVQGRNKFSKALPFDIDDSRKSRAEREKENQGKEPAKSDHGELVSIVRECIRKENNGNGDMLSVMQMMQEQSRQHQEMMQAQNSQTMQIIVAAMNRPQPAPPPAGPASDVAGIMAVIAPLLKSAASAPASAGDTWERDLDRLIQMRELMDGKDSDEPKGFGKFAKIFGEAVSGFLEARGLMLPDEPTAKQLQAPDQTPSNPEEQQMQEQLEAVRKQCVGNLPRLLDAKRWMVPTGKIADSIVEGAGENVGALAELLGHEQWKTILFNDDPRVVENLTWFEKLREALLSKCGAAEKFVASLANAEDSAEPKPIPQTLPDARSDDDDHTESKAAAD